MEIDSNETSVIQKHELCFIYTIIRLLIADLAASLNSLLGYKQPIQSSCDKDLQIPREPEKCYGFMHRDSIPPQQHKEEAAREAPLEMNPAVEEKSKCFKVYVSVLL